MRLANSCRETLRQSAERGDAADGRNPARQHDLARVNIHQARHRDTDQHIENDVGRTNQEAQFLIAQVQIDFDPLRHHAEHLRVEEVQHGRENDDREPVISGWAGRPGLAARLRLERRHGCTHS